MPAFAAKPEMIVWDWNGTLLNDVDICIEAINRMLVKRGKNKINRSQYLQHFRFPVVHFYADLGFDIKSEDFDALSIEYINHFLSMESSSSLHKKAFELLGHFKSIGLKQVVLSALEQQTLENALQKHNIMHFFDEIAGSNNFYGNGKLDIAKQLINKSSVNRDKIIFIGDTMHDYEVAASLGCHCILVSGGHQPYDKLITTGVRVEKNLAALFKIFAKS
jgi:phosphoglycolate phosphatase